MINLTYQYFIQLIEQTYYIMEYICIYIHMLSYATIATRYVLIVEFIMLVAAWMCSLGDHLSSTIGRLCCEFVHVFKCEANNAWRGDSSKVWAMYP